jgi:hypothetical protein
VIHCRRLRAKIPRALRALKDGSVFKVSFSPGKHVEVRFDDVKADIFWSYSINIFTDNSSSLSARVISICRVKSSIVSFFAAFCLCLWLPSHCRGARR